MKSYFKLNTEYTCAAGIEDILELIHIKELDKYEFIYQEEIVEKYYKYYFCSGCFPEFEEISKEVALEEGIVHSIDLDKPILYHNDL